MEKFLSLAENALVLFQIESMKRLKKVPVIFGFAFVGAFSLALLSFESSNSKTEITSNETKGIHWMTIQEALEKHKIEPRMWVIDFWTDWCGWCKRMDKGTFSDPTIGKFVNENYYAVSFDAEQKEDITIEGRTYKFKNVGRRGYHELAAELMGGKMSYPTVVFLTNQRQVLHRLVGYQTKQEFHPIVKFLNEYDPNKPITFTKFKESYVSPYPEESPN